MNFIKWFMGGSWFHITMILGMIIYILTWPPALDKWVGLSFLSLVFLVLCIGKYRYWNKKLRGKE